MPSASSNGSGPRYAPEDPTLPEPWKGLVDGSTGYLYYWNPITDVTQYEKPIKEKLPGPPPLPPPPAKPASMSVSSSVHRDEDGRSRSHQNQGGRTSGSTSVRGCGDIRHENSSHSSRVSARDHGPSAGGGGLSVEEYCRQHEITTIGDDVPPPYMTFESTGFPSEILKEVHLAGFAAPTPIQAQSWPIALQSRDVVAIAKTGSGKTLGYLIPGFIHIKRLRNNPRMGPTVLVLAPTRELATQIQDEAEKFGRSSKLSCTCVYGGAPKSAQLRDIDRGVDIIVATPGRLNDILEMKRVKLHQVSYLVLDEADRMLDMGFEPQIRKIVKEIPHRRQTLMYTATWPKEVRKIAADLLVHPVHVNIGNVNELVANKAITQYVELIKPFEKQRRLEQILRSQEAGSKVIIFCSTKRMCDQLASSLTRQFGAAAIHGDKNQGERDRVLGHFRTGKSPILVATDVAARGLDIKDIRVVINYDFPTGVEDYVHRIGRTGRAGATGVSYTFFSDQDSKYARDLVKVLEGADQRVPSELRGLVSFGGNGGRSRRWGGARDQARSNGVALADSIFGAKGGRADSTFGANGGRGMPPAGRADGNRGLYRNEHDSRDRYVRGQAYNDRHDVDAKVRQVYKPISKTSIHSRSLSPRVEEAKGRPDTTKAASRGRLVRSRSGSRSLSPSPKRARVGQGRRSRSRSRSRSNGLDQSRVVDRHGRSTKTYRRMPSPKREAESADRSPVHRGPKQQRNLSPASYDDGEIRDHCDRSPSPRKKRSRSPNQSREDRLPRSPSPRKSRPWFPPADNGRQMSPNHHPSIDKVVGSRPSAYFGDEEYEEGMIHPDEDMISPRKGN